MELDDTHLSTRGRLNEPEHLLSNLGVKHACEALFKSIVHIHIHAYIYACVYIYIYSYGSESKTLSL